MYSMVETDFGLNMLRNAPANDSLVVSPISVIFALAMVQAGAKGTTKSQINTVISNEGASDIDIAEQYSNLSSQIMKASNGVRSRIANGFFLNKQHQIEKSYEEVIKKKYDAKVETLDFGKAQDAAKVFDDFISKATEGKIQNMVNEQSVKGAFSLIVNAIYFTAKWLFQFSKGSNTNETFYSARRNERKIVFMNDFDVFRPYAEDNDLQVLSLPYKDNSFAFNIFLPRTRFGLEALRSSLTGERIQNLLSKLKTTSVTITIPEMKIETDFKLKQALMAMGVRQMFSDNADLTGITKKPPLKVTDATHRAIIEVDEEGTTAAAVTVITVRPTSASTQQPVQFQADHPFLFILTKDNNPLFMGHFV